MKNPLLSFALAAAIFAISSGNVAHSSVAYSISNIIKQAEVIKANAVISANSTMIKVSTTIKGFAANDPYMVKNVDVPKANFLSHAKNNMGSLVKRNAWYAGWFATMAAAGWAIDELKNQVTKPVSGGSGTCTHNSNTTPVLQLATPDMCFAALQSKYPSNTYEQYAYSYGQNPPLVGKQTTYEVYFTNANGQRFKHIFSITYTSASTESKPVTDDDLYQSLVSHMLQDPKKAADAFMVPDPWPYPYPNIFPDTIPYIPGVSEADQEALDLYYKGLLQSTNPNAPYYVTPERYQQIAQLAQQLQQGQTPEGQTDAMNDALKKPLTQKELEESLKKEREAEEKAIKESLGDQPAFDELTEPLDKFIENVNKTPQDEINPLPQNTFGIAGSGTCYKIEKPISIMGVTVNMSTRSFCDAYYYPYFLPILTWFFYIATGLYIWFSLRDAYSRRI